MYKAYKFRLYPNDSQRELINKTFGCSRLVYNHYLSLNKEKGYTSPYTNINDYVNNYKYEKTFLQEIDSTVIRKTIFHLDDNLKRCYKSNFGYPKFKSKDDRNSYMTSAIYRKYKDKNYCNIELDLNKKEIKLPKLNKVKIRGYRNLNKIEGRIINATISKERNNKYYVSVMIEIPSINKKEVREVVGIDLGIKKLITLSNGLTYDNNNYIEKYEKRIKRLQRELSRKEKGSKNYYKCKMKLNILYIKLSNARKYYLHKVTKEITDKYDVITSEGLNTKSMIMKKELSKEITDASFSEILWQLRYKCLLKGKYFYQVDTYYPSSQMCSVCENIDKKYKKLNERIYKCTKCNSILDRDLNASINIMFEGIKLYMKEVFS